MITPEEKFMKVAIEEAIKARKNGDYAIGAVIVKENEIIFGGPNRSKIDQDSTQHAEMVAIRGASKVVGSRFLSSCVLYTTHEPCPMCAAAAVWARMDGIVFGSTLQDMIDYRSKNATKEWTWRTVDIPAKDILAKGEPKLEIVGRFMRQRCLELFHT